MIVLGVAGFLQRQYMPIWTGVPKGMPARQALAYLCALVSVGCGIGLLWRRAAALASGLLLGYFIAWMMLFRVPLVLRAPFATVTWWAIGETAVLVASAWVLYGARSERRVGQVRSFIAGQRGIVIARALYGLALIPFGVAHFTYLGRTISMVPGWLPWHVGWAYFTGFTLIAAGLAIVIGVYARLAAVLSAFELGLFTLFVWIPVVVAGADASQWSEFTVSWVLTTAAWVVADSYRGVQWLAARAAVEAPL